MLIKYDDLPLQQTTESLAYVLTSDRNAYGRYWFNGYSPDGDFYFGIAFGIYPNRDVMDCALSIVRSDGTQDSFRASRRCPPDRTAMKIGPFRMEIIELMRTIKITIDDNCTGITADLTFYARTAAHEEPTDFMRSGKRVVMHTKRYTQFGMWSGHITVKGRRQDIDPTRIYGVRDRSWGWRAIGETEGGTSTSLPPQILWLWAPIHWQDRCTHYGLFEHANGQRWKEFAHVFPVHQIDQDFDTLETAGMQELVAGEHRILYEKGTRYASSAEIDLLNAGNASTVELDVILRFYMYGIGYGHPEWGHGMWKGEEAISSEHWHARDIDPRMPQFQHVQQVVKARQVDQIGYGVLEQLVLGDHHRYGLKGFTDPL